MKQLMDAAAENLGSFGILLVFEGLSFWQNFGAFFHTCQKQGHRASGRLLCGGVLALAGVLMETGEPSFFCPEIL
jgi:hypothetical protein